MLKKFLAFLMSGLIAIFFLSQTVIHAQQISLTPEKVAYNLPYPGILPDHPLYFFKTARDQILIFFTRDNIKKTELYLLLSDKRIKMAEELSKKGKNQLAITTFSKGEKYFLKIPEILTDSKKQGVSPTQELLDRLKLANEKHKEVLDELIKTLPQGEQEGLSEIGELNREVSNALSRLK